MPRERPVIVTQKLSLESDYTTHDNFGRLFMNTIKPSINLGPSNTGRSIFPNFTDNDAWLGNTEASLNVMLNSIFSLKFAYLLQYQNMPSVSGKYTSINDNN